MNGARNLPVVLFGLLALTTLVGCVGVEPMHSDSPIEMPIPQSTESATPVPTLHGVSPPQTPTSQPTKTAIPMLTPSPTAIPWPTENLVRATPTQVPHVTSTPIPASKMRGEWRRFTTADGLCTDWPVFIGVWYIGTGTTTICYSTEPVDETTWPDRTVPLGTRVTAVDKFPPGGGELYATDAGVCWFSGGDDWECQTLAEGYPYEGIRRIDHILDEEVLMLVDAIAYKGKTYSIPEIIRMSDARPTWIAVSGRYVSPPSSEIWVGTNGYGIIVIQPETEVITRHTTLDGLLSDIVRDIDIGAEIWVATNGGAGRWDGQYWTAYTTADGLPSDDVRGVAVYQDTVWVATAGGAAYFDGQSWQAFTYENGLPEGDLNGVKFMTGGIGFSTRGSGLLVFISHTPTQ